MRPLSAASYLFILLFLALLYIIREALYPFLIAFALAYLFDPLLDKMEEKKIPRTAGIMVLLLSVFGAVLIVSFLLYPVMERQVVKAIGEMPRYAALAQEKLSPVIEKVSNYDKAQADLMIQKITEKIGSLPMEIIKVVYGFIVSIFSSVAGIVSTLFGMVVIPVAAFYFMRDIDKITTEMKLLIPAAQREEVMTVSQEINKTLSAYLRGQFTVAIILSVVYTAGLYLIGTPMGMFIGILAGMSIIVPYLPLFTGLIPALLLTYFEFGLEREMVEVLLLFIVISVAEGFFITPKIMGESIGLHPLAIMFALLVGGMTLGIVGLMLAVPVAAVIKVLLKRLLEKYKSSDFYSKKEEE